jgi:hypothetical protein
LERKVEKECYKVRRDLADHLIASEDYDKMAQRKETEITVTACKRYPENCCHHLSSLISVEKWTHCPHRSWNDYNA